MPKTHIIEFEPQYTNEAKELARLAMIDVGLDPKTIDLYMEDDFDFNTISDTYKGRSRLWLALHESKVVGMIGMEEIDGDTARLRRMFVLPELHREGVGQQLFDTAFAFAKEQGYKKITLDTDKQMHKAHRFYEKNGFHRTKTERDRIFYEREI